MTRDHVALREGAGDRDVTATPASLLHFAPHLGKLRVLPIALPAWQQPTMILTLKERVLGPAALRTIDTLRERAQQLHPQARGPTLSHVGPS
jgi:hypothetical protein